MFETFTSIIWLFLPAVFANMAPVLFNRVNFLNYSIDSVFNTKRKVLFGKNKTFRGFFFGILSSISIMYIQTLLNPYFNIPLLISYDKTNILALGILLGFGALCGDLIESYFKRRRGTESGKSWVPFDQIDWILGALFFSSILVKFHLEDIIIVIIFFDMLHPITNLAGYFLGLKKNKF